MTIIEIDFGLKVNEKKTVMCWTNPPVTLNTLGNYSCSTAQLAWGL